MVRELMTAASGMVGLGFLPGGNFSTAGGVSANGTVVVGQAFATGILQAFRWTAASGMVGLVARVASAMARGCGNARTKG